MIHERALDSVALTTQGRSGPALAVHGSVAQRFIRRFGVPVLRWAMGGSAPARFLLTGLGD